MENFGPYSIAIASLFGTLVSYLLLSKQMKNSKQHIELLKKNITASYLPKISILPNQMIKVFYDENEDILPFRYEDAAKKAIIIPKFEVINVGLAAASQIEFYFKYDTKAVEQLIKKNNISNKYKMSIEDDYLQIDCKITNTKITGLLVYDSSINSNFMLPASVSKETLSL